MPGTSPVSASNGATIMDMLNPKTFRNLRYRAPRPYTDKHGNTKMDNPRANYQEGQSCVALGGLALLFASLSLKRTRLEKTLLLKMWNQNMTIKKLRHRSKHGDLPAQVLLRGTLAARGKPITSLASECSQLKPLMGKINQPENLFLRLGQDVVEGHSDVPTKYFDGKLRYDDVEVVQDDFTTRETSQHQHQRDIATGADMNEGLILSEIFVTRLGCEAKAIKEKNKPVRYKRHKRQGRFNVLHNRRVSDGLHFIDQGSRGDKVDIELPEFGIEELKANSVSPLFLSVPDPMNEFKRFASFSKWIVKNADTSLTHLSKFIHLDQQSKTDDGRFASQGGMKTHGVNALDQIGKLVPNGWVFHPKGFYDNNPGTVWPSFKKVEEVNYTEFKRRIAITKEENSKHQEYTYWNYDKMMKKRDDENCFRVVELGIPNYFDVVLLARPVVDDVTGDIKLVSPEEANFLDISKARFYFRILWGNDNIDNLMKHRKASMQAYLGFAAMAASTIIYGEELMRDALVSPIVGGGLF